MSGTNRGARGKRVREGLALSSKPVESRASRLGRTGAMLRSGRCAGGAVAVLVVLTVFGLRDVRRSGPDPIGPCAEYIDLVDTCMGKDAATRLALAYAKPPAAEDARTTMARECTASHERLRRACR